MSAITSRYARAFADVVFEHNPTKIAEELVSLQSLIASSSALREVWENPAISSTQKRAVLDSIAAKTGMVKPLRNFIAVLIDHGRIPQLEEITRQFQGEINQRLGVENAEVTSVRELAPAERQQLEKKIATATGKKIKARYATDPGLLGGVMVRVGSTIYDGSVRGQLQKLKEELAAGV